eukprot:TRINITY_DN42080_c0_g1_i1.p1 TRINITY_DN42080_c0_g1~~TRINITY_DN42080_c0_g1_i1.p1  ORF type:complete len:441 (-),score=86.93 TRINITY_DN42080_c0_g1_i1:22-1344(-)
MDQSGRSGGELKVVEFFAGIGGMRAATLESGLQLKVIAAYEVSDLCKQAYHHNYGKEDWRVKTIERIPDEELDALRADVWLMSPPCQPFTRSGLRRDHEDDRSRALLHLVEVLPRLRNPPRWILLENVIGFERSECRRRLLEALAALDSQDSSGWQTAEFALDPEDFGLPNRRPRYYGLFTSDHGREPPADLSGPKLGCKWVSAAVALEQEDPLMQSWPGQCLAALPLGTFLQSPEALAEEEKTLGCSVEVSQEVMLTRLKKEKRYDVHLRADCTSACLTKANGRLPYGHSPLVVVDEAEAGLLMQQPKLSVQGQGPGAATDHVWKEGVRVRYLSPAEQLRLMGYPKSYSFPASVGFKDRCSLIGNSLNVRVVSKLLPLLVFGEMPARPPLPEQPESGAGSLPSSEEPLPRSAEELVSKAWGPRERWSLQSTGASKQGYG